MHVTPIPCFADNYAYLVWQDGCQDAVVVDASEAAPVVQALRERALDLRAVLSTHHHWDHVGGNQELARLFPAIEIVGHVTDRGRLPGLSRAVEDREILCLAGLRWCVHHVPGHTLGAVAYGVQDALFTGDTLFIAGCGRLFEGTADMMYGSLNHRLAALPGDTRVYCGHEYARQNLRFAQKVEPTNAALFREQAKLGARSSGNVSVPSTLRRELETNPFFRCSEPTVAAFVSEDGDHLADPVEVFRRLRLSRDDF